MAHHSIEETFQAIKPRGRRAVPGAPAIDASVSSNGDLPAALSQAGQQIAQLQASYQQQLAAVAANTQAIQGNTSAQGSHLIASTAGSVASGLESGFGLLGPLISGIAGLFGSGSKPAALPVYLPPAPVSIEGSLRVPTSDGQNGNATNIGASPAGGSTQLAAAPSITVNISAMDSQSFMDRSADIASAVREAMLNLHPINDVVANL